MPMIDDQATLAARKAFYRRINKALEDHKRENTPQAASATPTAVRHQELVAFIKQAGISQGGAHQALLAAAKMMTPFRPSALKAAGNRRWQQSRQQPSSDWRD